MKKLALVAVFLMLCGVAQAATITLKNGSTVSGKILSRTADAIKLDVSGVTLTYYNDEIQTVDDAGDVAPEPSAGPVPGDGEPAAVVQPEAAQPLAVEPVVPVAQNPLPAAEKAPVKLDRYAGLTKRQLIYKFIEAFGTVKSMQANLKYVAKQLPPEQAEKFEKSYKIPEIIEQLAPLYDKRFSEAELKEFIDFYSSPVGQKLVEAIPQIMLESVTISEKYFSDHLPKDMFDTPPGKGKK